MAGVRLSGRCLATWTTAGSEEAEELLLLLMLTPGSTPARVHLERAEALRPRFWLRSCARPGFEGLVGIVLGAAERCCNYFRASTPRGRCCAGRTGLLS